MDILNPNSVTLLRMEFQGQQPAVGDREGTANFGATFRVRWEGQEFDVVVSVATPEGWEVARHLACEKFKTLGQWLVLAGEHQKTAPHIVKLA